jgi:hypothetical protein
VRRVAIALLVLLAGGLLSGCARVAQDRDLVLSAIDATERLSRSYTYAVSANGHDVSATAVIADDFRYRVDASRDGHPVASEVVVDDALAVRFDSTVIATVNVNVGQPGTATVNGVNVGQPGTATVNGVNVGQPGTAPELPRDRWLVDPKGAASLAQQPPATRPSDDPLADSLSALEYVRAAVVQAQEVRRYNPQSESYRPRLDPFPAPAGGTIRYDLVPTDLPPREQVGSGNIGIANQVPGAPFFRLMAIYVDHGLVREVREQVAIEPRLLDSESNLAARLGDFVKVPPNAPVRHQALALLAAVNRQLAGSGRATVQPRTMHLVFTALGRPGPIALPQGATPVDLSALGPHGLLLYESS